MKPSFIRLATKVTLFTRPQCGLCDGAKSALSKAWDDSNQKFDYLEIDVTKSENSQWFDKYAFDVPVVHIERDNDSKIHKLMHRIAVKDVLDVVDR